MIKKTGCKAHWGLPKKLEEELLEAGITKEDIQKFKVVICGTHDNDYYSEYTLTDYSKKPSDTWWQRLNCLWVYPLFIISIPFRYVMYGDHRFQPNSKMYRIISKLIGEDK